MAIERERCSNLRLARSTPPDWVLDLPQFKGWQDGQASSNLLWLCASTGYGKSVLAAYLTELLQLALTTAEKPWVVYFFCKHEEGLYEAPDIVRALACQLASYSKEIRAQLMGIWKQKRAVTTLTENLGALFQDMIAGPLSSFSSHPIYFILDAFNECPSSSLPSIAKLIASFRKWPAFKVIVTCQPIYELHTALAGASTVKLDESHNWSTVESYITKKLDDDQELAKRFQAMNINAADVLRREYRGMFLWVSLILDELSKAVFEGDFREILREGPGDISVIYSRIFRRLAAFSVSQKLWLKQVFLWLVVTKRPLRLEELEMGIRLSRKLILNQTALDPLINFELTLSVCGALLRITDSDSASCSLEPSNNDTAASTSSSSDTWTSCRYVSFVHNSLEQYLTTGSESNGSFFIDKKLANGMVGFACIDNILLRLDGPLDHDILVSYSSINFPTHLQASQPQPPSKLLERLAILLSSERLEAWFSSLDFVVNESKNVCRDISEEWSKSLITLVRCLQMWEESEATTLCNAGLESITILSRIVGTLKKLWLREEPSARMLGERDWYYVLQVLHAEFGHSADGLDPVTMVGSILSWCGSDDFERDSLWHYNVGKVYLTSLAYHPERATEHFRQAMNNCRDLKMQSRLWFGWNLRMHIRGRRDCVWDSEERNLAQSIIQFFDEIMATWVPNEPLEPHLFCDFTTDLIIRKFKKSAALDDLVRVIQFEEKRPDSDGFIHAILLSIRWSYTKTSEDVASSTELLEKALKTRRSKSRTMLSDSSDWSHITAVDARRWYNDAVTPDQLTDYIAQVEEMIDPWSPVVGFLHTVLALILVARGDSRCIDHFSQAVLHDPVNKNMSLISDQRHQQDYCGSCHSVPIIGMRYVCLQCLALVCPAPSTLCEECYSELEQNMRNVAGGRNIVSWSVDGPVGTFYPCIHSFTLHDNLNASHLHKWTQIPSDDYMGLTLNVFS